MRYAETGEVHLDFHRTINGTFTWLRERYGQEFVDDLVRRTALDVYRSIHEDLKAGDPDQWLEHQRHFLSREGGEYELHRDGDEVRLEVHRCPAIAYLESRGIPIDEGFCHATVVLNEALAEGGPFTATTEVLGGGRCRQTLRRRAG